MNLLKYYFSAMLLAVISPAAFAVSADTIRIERFLPSNKEVDSGEAFRQAIAECNNSGAKVLKLQNTTYHFWPENASKRSWFISNTSSREECPDKEKTIGLLLEDCNGLTIEGEGASLLFHGKMTPVAIVNSSDITLRNLSVDFVRPTMSEMTVINSRPGVTDVKFHPDSKFHIDNNGHLSLVGESWRSEKFHCISFDPKTQHLNFSRAWNTLEKSPAEVLSGTEIRFHTPQSFRETEGTVLTVRDIIRDQVGVFICKSDNVTLESLGMRYMHGLGIVSQRSKNLTFRYIDCSPNPQSNRLMASSADFMHFSGCGGKISITECNFSGAHDDAINIHGTNMRITKKIDNNKIVATFMHPQSYGFEAFEPSDSIAFISSDKLQRFGTAIIKDVKRISDYDIELTFEDNTLPEISVNKDCVENISWTPEAEIKNCRFSNISTRGILLTTPRKALIESNTFFRTAMSAILIESDAENWFESGPVKDVTIRNNTFIDCAYLNGPAQGVIAVRPSNTIIDQNSPVHSNIRIVGNNFYTYGNPAVYAKSTENLVIKDNTVTKSFSDLRPTKNRNPKKPDLSDGIYSERPFVLTACKDSRLSGNKIHGYDLTQTINPSKTLWFDKPASIWEEMLPLGDGRLGLMADGGIRKEHIVLNDITLWSGSENDYSNDEAAKHLHEIRRLLIEGKNAQAQDSMYMHFVPRNPQDERTYGTYQVLANLDIDYIYDSDSFSPLTYSRTLDLDKGLSVTKFIAPDSTVYTRTYAVPRGQDAILVNISSSKPSAVNFDVKLSRPERARHTSKTENGRKYIMINGNLDSGIPDVEGMGYAAALGVNAAGGSRELIGDSILSVRNADNAWIVVTAATSYLFDDRYASVADSMLTAVIETPQTALNSGVEEHSKLMDRAELVLNSNDNSFLPTPRRLELFCNDDSDASLAALYYNYARFLLISSTNPNLLPPNLQGLWAKTIQTPWNGDYHTNINIQMNHWPVEPGNLSELHLPLVNLTRRAVPSGERTAKSFYGKDADGWVMHMMTNVWNYTEPGSHPSWGATNTGGAWLCNHLWQHYIYNPDSTFLSEIYPVMAGAARFFLSTMIREPKHNYLVTAPSSSPENSFYAPDRENYEASVCLGPTMDTQIISELWSNVIQASKLLNNNDPLADSLAYALTQLPPESIDSTGRLMEWLEEYTEVDPHHRHVSHLYGLYPGHSISPYTTPKLAEAAKNTLDVRGDEGTGWSRAWKVNFHARLLNGNRAWKLLKALLTPAISEEGRRRAGSFPNLFCSHPPFQIDGNFGGAAGILQMFIQDQPDFVELLPALPDAVPDGQLRGIKLPGGAEIDFEWKDRLPKQLYLRPGKTDYIKLKVPKEIKSASTSQGITIYPDSQNILNVDISEPISLQFD